MARLSALIRARRPALRRDHAPPHPGPDAPAAPEPGHFATPFQARAAEISADRAARMKLYSLSSTVFVYKLLPFLLPHRHVKTWSVFHNVRHIIDHRERKCTPRYDAARVTLMGTVFWERSRITAPSTRNLLLQLVIRNIRLAVPHRPDIRRHPGTQNPASVALCLRCAMCLKQRLGFKCRRKCENVKEKQK